MPKPVLRLCLWGPSDDTALGRLHQAAAEALRHQDGVVLTDDRPDVTLVVDPAYADTAPGQHHVAYPWGRTVGDAAGTVWAPSRWHQRLLPGAPKVSPGTWVHAHRPVPPSDGGIVLLLPAGLAVPREVLEALGDGVYPWREAPGDDAIPSLPVDPEKRAAVWYHAVAVVIMPGCETSLPLAVEVRSAGVPVLIPKGDPADELLVVNGIGSYGVQLTEPPRPDLASLTLRLNRLAANGFAVRDVDFSSWTWERWAVTVDAVARGLLADGRATDGWAGTAVQPMPATGGERVIILSLTPLTGNLTMEGLLTRALRQAGADVAVLRCNGVRERCTVDLVNPHVGGRTSLCLNCTISAERTLTAWNGAPIPTMLLDDWVEPELLNTAYGHLEGCPDEGLLDFAYDGLPLGQWVTAALRIEYFGEDWRSLPDLPRLTRVWLRSAVAVAVALSAMLLAERPSVIVVLGGLLPWERAAMALAHRYGLRCVYYEGGQRPGSMILRGDSPACQYNFTPEWREWADVPLTIAEASHLDGFLRHRQRVGHGMTYVFSPAASGKLDPIRRRLGLQPGRRVLVAFSSVVVDTISFEAQTAFPSQAAWLQACVAYAESHPDIDLIVRVHPAELTSVTFRGPTVVEARDQAAEVLHRRWEVLPPNVRLIPSDDLTSSYDLIAMATVVLNYISTIGLEAAAAGWPVVTAGWSHYSLTGIVWQADNPDHFCSLLDRLTVEPAPPADGPELARRYFYFWFFRCTPVMPGLPLEIIDIVGPPKGPLPYWDVPGDGRGVPVYVDYLLGRGPFVAPPVTGRPRDAGRPRPLRPPERPVLVLWPQGWTGADLVEHVVRPLRALPRPWTVIVLPAAGDWVTTARTLAAAVAASAGHELDVRFLPGPMADHVLQQWLAVASAAAWHADRPALEALITAYGVPGWSRIVEELGLTCGSP